MIGRLTGIILECSPGEVVMDVSGVGYTVQIPLSTFYPLVHRNSDVATLHVHTHVREDSLTLFGFSTREERTMFVHLIAISGIGPKVALAILSGIGVQDLRVAVLEKDRARLQRIPGVGRKTAERLFLELGDRLKRTGKTGAAVPEELLSGTGPEGTRADAVSALQNLGYSEEVARRAVEKVLKDRDGEPDLEGLLKDALGVLVRK